MILCLIPLAVIGFFAWALCKTSKDADECHKRAFAQYLKDKYA